MEKDSKYHMFIRPDGGTKLKFNKKDDKKPSDSLPAHIGTIFKSKEEVKEEVEMKRFKDFLK